MVLMDMPGYGQNSRQEWGVEIAKYLSRRKMLRGAVVLIDAVAGVKDGDRMVLRLLRDANVRTTVVLTKADKLGYGAGVGGTKGVREVGQMCEGVWKLLRELEAGGSRDGLSWTEGEGWEREIWVTGAGDPRNGGLGVEGARFAIARMAGLVADEREEVGQQVVLKQAQRIVPFEELQWRSAGGSGRFEVRA
jgi:GTP-binding protein